MNMFNNLIKFGLIEEIGLRAASKGKYNNLNNKKKTKKRKRK